MNEGHCCRRVREILGFVHLQRHKRSETPCAPQSARLYFNQRTMDLRSPIVIRRNWPNSSMLPHACRRVNRSVSGDQTEVTRCGPRQSVPPGQHGPFHSRRETYRSHHFNDFFSLSLWVGSCKRRRGAAGERNPYESPRPISSPSYSAWWLWLPPGTRSSRLNFRTGSTGTPLTSSCSSIHG